MNNPDTELLFPLRVAGSLSQVRGIAWQNLVDKIVSDQTALLDQLAFVMTMVKVAGCISCNSDSFRAMRGCTLCSIQAVRRYRGTDQELLTLFEQSLIDVERYLKKCNLEDTSAVYSNRYLQ